MQSTNYRYYQQCARPRFHKGNCCAFTFVDVRRFSSSSTPSLLRAVVGVNCSVNLGPSYATGTVFIHTGLLRKESRITRYSLDPQCSTTTESTTHMLAFFLLFVKLLVMKHCVQRWQPCPGGLTRCTHGLGWLHVLGWTWVQFQVWPSNPTQDHQRACFEINFSDRKEGSMVSSIICDHW